MSEEKIIDGHKFILTKDVGWLLVYGDDDQNQDEYYRRHHHNHFSFWAKYGPILTNLSLSKERKIIEYILVSEKGTPAYILKINTLLKNGWELYGYSQGDMFGGEWYIEQAMVKYE